MKGFPDLPPLWWMGSIAGIYLAKWALPALHIPSSVATAASWGPFIAALVLIAWSAIWFWRKGTPIEPHHDPKVLIVEGPYRVSRNPIYLALVLLTVASALGHGSIIGLGLAASLWWVLDKRFAAVEEALLLQSFGPEAEDYIRRTRRWI